MKNLLIISLALLMSNLGIAQTVIIPGDTYAFQYSANQNYGLYFNETDVSYDFRNGAAAQIFSLDAINGEFKTPIKFNATSDLLIDADRYAFRYSGAPNYGLFFNVTDERYEFRTLNATPVFHIGANTGDLYTTGKVGINTKSPTTELDVHGTMSFDNTLGDKISLLDDRIGDYDIYGFGVQNNTLTYKSNGHHKWTSPSAPTPSAPPGALMILTETGNLGIGTETPNVDLVVESANARMKLQDNAGNNSENAARIELLEYSNGNFNDGAFIWWNGLKNKLFFGTKNAGVNENVMVIDRAGLNVGIGTQIPDPNYRLSVNGKIRAKEIVVETGWADFVFEEDYNLRSIS